MYKGYIIQDFAYQDSLTSYQSGRSLYDDVKGKVMSSLKKYTSDDGIVNGTEIQKDWFPEIAAHVFISHSHADEKLAITFAGWLYQVFGLKAFVDSCIWGNVNELLKLIDDKYCWQPESGTYNYSQRNHSTAHVHMLLMTALNKMIDKTECLFFLNTGNSVLSTGIKEQTLSPWIYGEIETSRIIRKRLPKRQRREVREFSQGGVMDANESLSALRIANVLETEHLPILNRETLNRWKLISDKRGESALDTLYELTSPKSI